MRRYLERTLFWLEWGVMGLLLGITLIWPRSGVAGIPVWTLVVAFAGYTLVANLAQRHLRTRRAFAWRYVLDLPVTALVYFLAGEPGGPLFVLFILGIDCAAASMRLHGTLIYTGITAAAFGVTDLMLWSGLPGPLEVRQLLTRLVILGLVGIGMAILTRRLVLEHEVTQSVRDEAERLEVLDGLRADFVSSVSHDLRTPLTAIHVGLGMLDAGTAQQLAPDERQLLSDARANASRLGRLIDDLLTYNQLEVGTLRLDAEPVDLRTLVTDAISSVQSLLASKRQTLETQLLTPLPIVGDPRRLEQVVVNLLANAHHHTPEGSHIAFSGRLSNEEALLSVRDNGPGIPREELETIFKRFHRVVGTGQGSGLGLAIAKGIVELHRGRIWAESGPGEGASFHVALPVTGRRESMGR